MQIAEIKQKLEQIRTNKRLVLPLKFFSSDDLKQREELEKLKQERAKIINRVGQKLMFLRETLIKKKRGDEFARFRFSGRRPEWEMTEQEKKECVEAGFKPGGVYFQNEERREDFIDWKIRNA